LKQVNLARVFQGTRTRTRRRTRTSNVTVDMAKGWATPPIPVDPPPPFYAQNGRVYMYNCVCWQDNKKEPSKNEENSKQNAGKKLLRDIMFLSEG